MAEQEQLSAIEFNRQVVEEFRASTGKVGGMFEGAPLVLLTTTGAKTGNRRTSPMMYLRDGNRILVFASNAGLPEHPAWYHNLLANPSVTVEIGAAEGVESYEATAVPVRGQERDRLYARQADLVPGFAEYQAKTSRVIPVVALHRSDTDPMAARARAGGEELRTVHAWFRTELAALRRGGKPA